MIFFNVMAKEIDILDDHGCGKIRDVVDTKAADETWISFELPIQAQNHNSVR